MISRSIFFGAALVVCLLCVWASVGVGETEEWESLFNGKNLDGWIQRGGKARYKAEDGVIVGTSVKGTPNSFLCTGRLFGDFILELDFKVDPGLNSGIQIRSDSHRAYKNGRVHGYQVEIDPSERALTGGIYDEARRGWLDDLSDNEAARKVFKQGKWNHLRVEASGSSIKTLLNGVPAADLEDYVTPVGFLALQVHQTDSEKPLQVRWRNIRIQDLDKYNRALHFADPHMGDWQVEGSGDSPVKAAQVIALGRGKYQVNLLEEFDSRAVPIMVMNGRTSRNGKVVTFRSNKWSGRIEGARFIGGKEGEGPVSFEMAQLARLSPRLGAKPPAGAVVLFDGTNLDQWQKADGKSAGWRLVEGGAMEVAPESGSIITRNRFADMKLHLEFRTPFEPEARGQDRGNSGVYIQDRYEVQVLDSYGLEGLDNECGGIYKVARPRVNMCAPPMQWQTYDIAFRTARLTVVHNGVTIHEDLEIPGPTGGARSKKETSEPGPILLQEHGNTVRYRNIWAVDLAGE